MLELLLVGPARPDAVRQLDLLRVGNLLAGERPRGRLERPHLCREPPIAVDLREQLPRVVGEARGLDERLVVDPLPELLRPVVGVDELRLVPPEPQPELEVALRDRHRAKSAAWPWPTPTQRVASPYRPPRRRSSWRRETTSRAPPIPSGWPSAIAPPFTFTFSSSSPSSRMTTRLCEAKASLSSTRSRSPGSTPARARSFLIAGIGPIPITC